MLLACDVTSKRDNSFAAVDDQMTSIYLKLGDSGIWCGPPIFESEANAWRVDRQMDCFRISRILLSLEVTVS